MNLLAKTDALDAHAIALFAQRIRPDARPLKDEQQREFEEMLTPPPPTGRHADTREKPPGPGTQQAGSHQY
jgi:hypothetical protein